MVDRLVAATATRRGALGLGLAAALAAPAIARASYGFNVKDYGAAGNAMFGPGGLAGNDDTDAINQAIAAAGSGTLVFPDGAYIIRPGGLAAITGNVFGPSAVAVAADLSDAPIFVLNYHETYPVPFGSGTTGLGGWRSFEMRQIIGGPDLAHRNIGIYCQQFDQSSIRVGNIRGCRIGIFLNGDGADNHQGTNRIDFDTIYTCQCGILMWSGLSQGSACESNVVTGRYMFGFSDAAISLFGGGGAAKVNNVFKVDAIGGISATTQYAGIILDQNCAHNRFQIQSWDNEDAPGFKNLLSLGSNNRFVVPSTNGCAVSSSDKLVVQ